MHFVCPRSKIDESSFQSSMFVFVSSHTFNKLNFLVLCCFLLLFFFVCQCSCFVHNGNIFSYKKIEVFEKYVLETVLIYSRFLSFTFFSRLQLRLSMYACFHRRSGLFYFQPLLLSKMSRCILDLGEYCYYHTYHLEKSH